MPADEKVSDIATTDIPSAAPSSRESLSSLEKSAYNSYGSDQHLALSEHSHDPDAIATQHSVFDEPGWEHYAPPPSYENTHRFDRTFRWTWREQNAVTRKTDLRIMAFCCVMFFALELDRSNIQQANSNNFLGSLGLSTSTYNLGNTVYKLSFLCAELPSQLVSKAIGPDRWIPAQICLWSIVSFSQFWLSGRASFLATRALLGLLTGGFIPDIILFLSYFYTSAELPIRLAGFWTTMYIADIFSAFIAIPIFKLDGHNGREGWRYLFLLEGLGTFVIGVISWFMMPASPTQTKTWFRPKGYFTEHEEKIIVNKVLRDSPSKSDMHNRQRLTFRMLWNALTDYHLWPLYIIGILFGIPAGPVTQYLTLILRGLKFSTTKTNLLTVPSYALNIIFLLSFTWLSERFKRRTLLSATQVVWCIPLLAALITFGKSTGPWPQYVVTMLLVGHPYSHAIQVSWVSRNSNSVAGRTVSAAVYNMFVQASSIIYSNIYQPSDKPYYHRGNKILLGIAVGTTFVYVFTFFYYDTINKRRERRWSNLTPEERVHYITTTTDKGSKRLDFRFAT